MGLCQNNWSQRKTGLTGSDHQHVRSASKGDVSDAFPAEGVDLPWLEAAVGVPCNSNLSVQVRSGSKCQVRSQVRSGARFQVMLGVRWSGEVRYKVSGQVQGGQVKTGTRYQVRYKVVR